MAACSSSSSSPPTSITDFSEDLLHHIASVGLSDTDVARLAATCKTLYEKLEVTYLRRMIPQDCGFPEIPRTIQTREEHAKILELRTSGRPVLDMKKTKELEGATLIDQASHWLMYQHRDDSFRKMDLYTGETSELWGSIKEIFETTAAADADKWMFHSSSPRLLVAVKLPEELDQVYSVDTFDERVKVVSLNPCVNSDIVSAVIKKQWDAFGDGQFIGAWEGEKDTLVVATQYERGGGWTVKLGAYNMTNGELLDGTCDVGRKVPLPTCTRMSKRNLPFAFNPKGNVLQYPFCRTTPMDSHDIFLISISAQGEMYRGYKNSYLMYKIRTSSREIITYPLHHLIVQSKNSKTFIASNSRLTVYSNDKAPESKTWSPSKSIRMLGDKLLVVYGSGRSMVIDSELNQKFFKLVPEEATVDHVFASGRSIVVQRSGTSHQPSGFFEEEVRPMTVTRAYTWIK